MEMNPQTFFNALYNGEDVKTFFASKAPRRDFHPSGNNLRHTSVKSVSITGEHDEYYLPNLSHGVAPGKPGITDDTIFRCYSVFLDFDERDIMPVKFHIEPSAIVRRDDGMGWHVYFFTDPSENVKLWRQVMKQFSAHYNSDPLVCNPARWVRIPGSTRYKQEKDPERKPLKYEIIKCDNFRYSLEDLAASLPAPEKGQDHSWKHETPESLLKIVLETIRNAPQGERNKTLNFWAGKVFQRFPDDKREEITSALTDAAIEVGLDNNEISKTINSAKGYAEKNQIDEKRGGSKQVKTALELLGKYTLCRFKQERFLIRDNQALRIGSEPYVVFVQGEFHKETGDALSDAQINKVASIHKAQAIEAEEREVHIRTAAPTSARSYIDLNDGENTIIEVDANGWRVSKNTDVLFERPASMGALPIPVRSGSIESLREVFNLEREEDFPVIVAALCYILRGRPNNRGAYPIIIVSGVAGSAKSTFSRIIKRLVDPGSPEVTVPQKDIRSLFVSVSSRLILPLDNISYVDRDLSNVLCSIATGSGLVSRKLFTDADEHIFEMRRPIIINGISFDKASDLLSRSINIELRPLQSKEYKPEEEIWSTVERICPSIFGALLSMISNAMREEQRTEQNIEHEKFDLPRLADFGRFSVAFERGNGWKECKIMSSLTSSQETALEERAEGNTVILIIVEIVKGKGSWEGSASELLSKVKAHPDFFTASFSMQKMTAAGLGILLRREHSVFAVQGIKITRGRDSKKGRYWVLTMTATARRSSNGDSAPNQKRAPVCAI